MCPNMIAQWSSFILDLSQSELSSLTLQFDEILGSVELQGLAVRARSALGIAKA